jgi:hypothetical protein
MTGNDRPRRPGNSGGSGRSDDERRSRRPDDRGPSAGRKPSGGPRSDKPRSDRPRSDAPRSDRPRSDRPSYDRPRGDAPRSDRPRSDGPRTDRPRSDRPSYDRPRGDAPRSDRPRSDRPSSDRPRSDGPRPAGRPVRSGGGDRRFDGDGARDSRPPRSDRPDDAPRHDDPPVDEDVTPSELDKAAWRELKALSKENAEWVAGHLVMASRVVDDDPERAHKHALAASRRAGRVSVVRETVGITSYLTGNFALALRELRTYRRLSGSNDQLPLMVDCERGLGRPDRGLELAGDVDRTSLPVPVQVELAIARSGARLDMGRADLALGELEIAQLNPDVAYSFSPALFDSYAIVLEELGRQEEADTWGERADVAATALAGAGGDDFEDTVVVMEEDLDTPVEEQ